MRNFSAGSIGNCSVVDSVASGSPDLSFPASGEHLPPTEAAFCRRAGECALRGKRACIDFVQRYSTWILEPAQASDRFEATRPAEAAP